MKKGRGRGKERGRKSWAIKTQKGDKEVDELQDQLVHELGSGCIADLPKDISINILLRLSVKDLLICKCLCKTWHDIITSDPEFAKPHFAGAEVYPLIQSLSSKYVSRTLYLLEPPPESSSGYPECDDGVVSMKLDTKLKIPLLNAELLAINNEEEGIAKGKPYIKLRAKDHKLNVVNSCDGLLCLSEPKRHDPAAVCNPITGEYINLPVPTPSSPKWPWRKTAKFVDCGLGFSPKAKQYKVIRIFYQKNDDWNVGIFKPNGVYSKRMVEIHTLGTASWKMIGDVQFSTNNNHIRALPDHLVECELAFPTYLNGALHWFCVCSRYTNYLVSFNFDNEQFQSVLPLPAPLPAPHRLGSHMSLGVLRGCLCICEASGLGDIKVWVMKEYGVQESWEPEFYIDSQTDKGSLPLGLYSLINYLSNGAILLFHSMSNSVFYYDPKGPTCKFLVVSGIKSRFGVIAHIPSFISLKDMVMGDNLEVLNIKSRCEKFKLPGEAEALLLEEETLFLALGIYT